MSIEALRVEHTITLDRAHCLGEQIAGFCTSRQVAAHVACRTAQLTTVFAMVASGLGVSIVPAMARDAHADARHELVAIRNVPLEREIVAAWRRDRARSALARAFVGMVREELRGKAGSRRPGRHSRRGAVSRILKPR